MWACSAKDPGRQGAFVTADALEDRLDTLLKMGHGLSSLDAFRLILFGLGLGGGQTVLELLKQLLAHPVILPALPLVLVHVAFDIGNVLLELLHLVVELGHIVEEGEVLVLCVDEGLNELVDVVNPCGRLDLLVRLVVYLHLVRVAFRAGLVAAHFEELLALGGLAIPQRRGLSTQFLRSEWIVALY